MNQPVSFPEWKQVLAEAPFSAGVKAAYTCEILAFLRHCKAARAPATVDLARDYLEWRERQSVGPAREALRWFYRKGRGAGSPGSVLPAVARISHAQPPPAAVADLGGPNWERDLIKAARSRGFLWRTEQTYREWAVRFARFLAPRSPYVATGADVAAFLGELAVKARAAASTQKQALNALVFLMQEALQRELGEFDFVRAARRTKIPTVLSVGECRSLFAQMDGTALLMAELMYGSGIRLMELLRLRIHHADLERRQLQVYAGKGNKDRVTVLPEKLVIALRAHLDRLRGLWQADRAANVPAVWLPEGLDRKYPKAGVSWEWQWLFPSRELGLDRV